MKILSFTILFLATNSIFSQSCSGTLVLSSQAAVNAFPTNYPTCTTWTGNVRIGNSSTNYACCSPINDLSPLAQLTAVTGYLRINGCNTLPDLDGLQNLTSVGGELYCHRCDNLNDISQLSNLQNVGGRIGFEVSSLTSLNGLQNITNLGGLYLRQYPGTNLNGINPNLTSMAGKIELTFSSSLSDINVFSNITSLGGLAFQYLPNLNDISTFSNLTSTSSLSVSQMPAPLAPLSGIGGILTGLTIQETSATDLSFLSNISGLTGFNNIIWINNNNFLTSLNGLHNISNINSISINNNPQLLNFSPLNNATIASLQLSQSPLTNLSALQNLNLVGPGSLNLISNPNLSTCAYTNICNFINTPGNGKSISGNATGCASLAQVQAACLALLPVTWSKDLEVSKHTDGHLLRWSVAQQINNDYYEMEHSKNGIDFSSIGRIEGAGTFSEEINYKFIYKNLLSGTNYYRIKQVDIDGKYSYSNIASLVVRDNYATLYPNPAYDQVEITSPDENQIEIINQMGQVVKKTNVYEGSNTINIRDLSPGFYYIRDQQQNVQKLVKM